MKLFIMCLDGLEYRFVVGWKLRGLMQNFFSKYDNHVAGTLFTPLIWSSFLTGRDPKDYGYTLEYILRKWDQGPSPSWVRVLWRLRSRTLPFDLSPYRPLAWLRNLILRLGVAEPLATHMQRPANMSEEMKRMTFIERLNRESCRIYVKDFPSYNESRARRITPIVPRSIYERKSLVEEGWRSVAGSLQDSLKLADEHDVMLFYSAYPDFAHHLFYEENTWFLARRYYLELDRLARDLDRLYGSTSVIMIVSDHGFDPLSHTHTPYGFFSINRDPKVIPTKVTDFHDLVIDYVRTGLPLYGPGRLAGGSL